MDLMVVSRLRFAVLVAVSASKIPFGCGPKIRVRTLWMAYRDAIVVGDLVGDPRELFDLLIEDLFQDIR